MPKINTAEDLKKFIFGGEGNLYKVKKNRWGSFSRRAVVLSEKRTYIYSPCTNWLYTDVGDLASYEAQIYCSSRKKGKLPNPIFAKIKQMSDRFEKRKQDASSYV